MRKKFVVLLTVIILLGLLLRLYDLNKESIWVDEAYSLHYALLPSPNEVMAGTVETEGAPPGYYLLLHYWIKAFGSSEFSVRFPSLLAGALSIAIIFKIGEVLYDRRTGLIAALLLSTSMLQILFSQETRLYSIYGLLTLCTLYFFSKIYNKSLRQLPASNQDYFFYTLSMILSLYLNFVAGILIALYTFAALWHKKHFPWKKWLATNLAIILIALPLIPLFLQQYITADTGIAPELIQKGVPVFLAKLGVFFYAVPLMVVLLAAGAIFLCKKRITALVSRLQIPDYYWTLIILTFAMIYLYFSFFPLSILGFVLSRAPITHSFFLIRHSYFLVPILYLYLAYKISNFKRTRLTVLCIIALVTVNSLALSEYYQEPTKAEWQEAAQFIEERTTGTTTLLLDRGGLGPVFLSEYYFLKPEIIRLTWTEGRRENKMLTEEALLQVLQDQDEFWLILSGNYQPDEYYRKLLDKNYQRDISQEFYLIKVYHYTNN
ncbi:MAG TPA: glycosyltransferase family 39 protein [Candidatus Nanoarchaeia archaeon]|nr:glycosyltransferase family 39 protein [Candidatus Nanoarchaeia archaeon]